MLELAATAASVGIVRHALRGALDALGVPAERVADVVVAASEACSNVVVHAYPEASTPPPVFQVALDASADAATVSVRDRGRGMTPRVQSSGLGLGLSVIGALSERFEILAGDGGGVEIVMTFGLQGPGGGAGAAAQV